MLSFKEIRDLIDLVAERGLSGLEIEQAGFRIRIEGVRPMVADSNGSVPHAVAPAPTAAGQSLLAPEPAAEPSEELHVITSPIVGTFYRSASPEADPFASVGQKVSRGKILCIIE